MTNDKNIEVAFVIALIVFACAVSALVGMAIGQWPQIDATSRPAIISGGCTILAAMGGAGVVFWQLRRQAVNTITANKHNEAMKLKKDVYEEAQGVLKRATKAQEAMDEFIQRFLLDVQQLRKQTHWTPHTHGPDVVKVVETYHRATVEAAALADKWRIIDPRLQIFKIGIRAAMYDLRITYDRYAAVSTNFMSIHKNEVQAAARRPNDGQYTQLQGVTRALSADIAVVHNYSFDFGMELQSMLLGELFERTLPSRVPQHPNDKVLRLDDHAALQKYFLEETSWGRMMPTRITPLSSPAAAPPSGKS